MYYFKLENMKIVGFLEGVALDDTYTEVSMEEYNKGFKYECFNPKTREFSKLRETFNSNLQLKQEAKIEESKQLLKKWLQDNPLESNVTGKKALYTVTEEKQSLLTQTLLLAQLKQTSTTTWNAQGKVGEEWTVTELSQLALEIEAYVRPRIKKQQTYEVQINNCSTVEEIEQIVIEYDTI